MHHKVGLAEPLDPHMSRQHEKILDHYASGYEASRLSIGGGQLERERTRELLLRFLPPAPATILDIGGGPGDHACWLARQRYEVHLMDIVPLHVDMATGASRQQPDAPLASAQVGDARSLPWNNATADVVCLLGPLYHLTDRDHRMRALHEAHRVLKAGWRPVRRGSVALCFDYRWIAGRISKRCCFRGHRRSGLERRPASESYEQSELFYGYILPPSG
jgi:ubiquinone/menaquinone biosynthesis C-methylase UbiE